MSTTSLSRNLAVLIAAALLLPVVALAADEKPAPPPAAKTGAKDAQPVVVYPIAVMPFAVRGDLKDAGDKVSDLLFGLLSAQGNLNLVDRTEIAKVIQETELNLTGMVSPDAATKVGHLTGAKILVTGSVMEVGKNVIVVAKIIGTETSRVFGESVKGATRDDLATITEQLARQVAATIAAKGDQLVAPPQKDEDVIALLNEKLGKAKRPVVLVKVPERHVAITVVDPAVQTELILILKGTGFEVLDPATGDPKKADVVIDGEGLSETATHIGNLVSVKARVELKAVNTETGKVIIADRQTTAVVDLTEQIAGKKALQDAAAKLALRILPLIVK